jgi:hypothetical protein
VLPPQAQEAVGNALSAQVFPKSAQYGLQLFENLK